MTTSEKRDGVVAHAPVVVVGRVVDVAADAPVVGTEVMERAVPTAADVVAAAVVDGV